MQQESKQNVLVGLDLSSMDDYLLSFLGVHGQALTSHTIDILHVNEDPKKSTVDLEKKIEQTITNHQLDDFDIQLKEGDPQEVFKLWIESRNIDLAVLGHKPVKDHEVEVKKLVKKPSCSLLLVPPKKDYAMQTIGVALDFSEFSLTVLKSAAALAEKIGTKLVGLHTYQVPAGYHKTGKDHQEFADEMEENAKKSAEFFFKAAGIDPIEMHYSYDEEKKPEKYITKLVQDAGADLLVMGSKGRTAPASLLIDSVATGVIQTLSDTPMMIIKHKNENMDLLDALKEV